MSERYRAAGVDLAAADETVARIARHVRSTYRPEVIGDIGGFGGLVAATGAPGAGFCDACFTGSYPVAVPLTLRKHVLEEPSVAPTPVQTVID